MASQTPNLNLTLPTGTEGWKRSTINDNFTILDTKIGAVGNTSLQAQVTALNSQITNINNKIGYGAFFSDSINASATKTYTLSSSHRGIIFIIGAGGARCILIIRNGGLTRIGDYNSLTISFTNDTTLSITNSTETVLYMYANMYSGTIA